ncbi:hypothetical protein L1987_16438 [Smallanthus sonchifolius]|uniref:Uncharacterized protein n=1 Tax=Smallanthus sonchifolius TaxID=185202 RepID=A0ACB9J8T9_9ASTR|nr:hypothetical protein L1987_16438 [Smallanthus sonchifolius]
MALADFSPCVVISKSENLKIWVISGEIKTSNSYRNRTVSMEFEPDWTRLKKPSAFRTQVISTATSWARKISISDGYHEFL